ncbi:MAG: hypothetical protein KAX55_19280, partial [Propionivibrio sp.]|nr:hypothetical protein [Propionivibrio sp.]
LAAGRVTWWCQSQVERQVTNTLLPDCAIKPPAAEADYVDASIMLSQHGRRAPTARLGLQAPFLIST